MPASSYIGRWQRVRELGPGGWGRPFVLDRRPYAQGNPRLLPFTGTDEWWRSPEGMWVPTIRGGAFLGKRQMPIQLLGYPVGATPTQQTLLLDSAYTYNTSGDAFGVRFGWVESLGALSNVYYYIASAAAGTQVNINDLNAEFRNSLTNRPNTTLHDSGLADPNGEGTWIGWHKIAWGTGFTPVAGTEYWVVIADADGNITDYATLSEGLSQGNLTIPAYQPKHAADHATGFNGAGTSRALYIALVLELGSNVVGGCHADIVTPSSSDNRRGWYVSFTETIALWGLYNYAVMTSSSGAEYYANASATPGTATASTTLAATGVSGVTAATGYIFSNAVQPPKDTPVRMVFSFSAANTGTRKYSLGTGNGYNTVLRQARIGGAGWYWAEANGTTNWSNDDQDAQPGMALLVADQVAVAGGGGMLVHPGMAGGMRG